MSNTLTFSGIPLDGLDFLSELAQNNEREWFEANKSRYQALLPALQAFIAELGSRLHSISPQIEYDLRTNGSGSLMRIYRDTRFSKDKNPYKTQLAMVWWEGPRKKMANPSFGFQFNADGGELMAGVFGFDPEMLAQYREAVVSQKSGPDLATILDTLRANPAYTVSGEQTKRVPAGFDADHPRAQLLTYKGLWVSSPPIPAQALTGPELVDLCFERCRTMAPLQQWLASL